MKKRWKPSKNCIFSIAAIAFLWIFWLILYFAVGNDTKVPSIGDTFRAMGKLFAAGEFWKSMGYTFLRALYAFLLSLVLGLSLALVARLFAPLRAFFAPIISVLRTIPTLAIVLLILIWTSRAAAPVVVSFLVLFPAVYSAALTALDEAEEGFGELARAYRIPLSKQVFKMYLPLSAPALLKQAGGIFSLGLKITVSGEVLASTAFSLGGLMQDAKGFSEVPRLFALTIVVILLGFLLEGVCLLIYKYAIKWKTSS